jgi:hypothetical protein
MPTMPNRAAAQERGAGLRPQGLAEAERHGQQNAGVILGWDVRHQATGDDIPEGQEPPQRPGQTAGNSVPLHRAGFDDMPDTVLA